MSVQPQSSASASNISYSHQTAAAPSSLPSHQLPQQQAQLQGGQLQGSALSQHHQYVQHGLPTHLDPAQAQPAAQSAQVPQAPQQTLGAHSSYFRQQDPYFHTPTPPVSASQSQEGPYGSFGQLSGQLTNQSSHLAGFGDYGYGQETQRVGRYLLLNSNTANVSHCSRTSTTRTTLRPVLLTGMLLDTTRSKACQVPLSNLTELRVCLPLTLSPRSSCLSRRKRAIKRSPSDSSKVTRPLYPRTITPHSRKASTMAPRTILDTPSSLLNILLYSRDLQDPSLLRRLLRSRRLALCSRSHRMAKACTISSTLPVLTVTWIINTVMDRV